MGKIVVSENVTLDGVVEDPAGDAGFAHGGWFDQVMATVDRARWAEVEFDEARRAEALLLGRRSEEWFASRWASRGGDWADRLNGMPKYVVSSTIEEGAWHNSTVLRGDVVAAVSRLKRELPGEIVVYASRPLVLGAGARLLAETGGKRTVRLVAARAVGGGLAYLTYEFG